MNNQRLRRFGNVALPGADKPEAFQILRSLFEVMILERDEPRRNQILRHQRRGNTIEKVVQGAVREKEDPLLVPELKCALDGRFCFTIG